MTVVLERDISFVAWKWLYRGEAAVNKWNIHNRTSPLALQRPIAVV